MERNVAAYLSQGSISSKKIIYVEGSLDRTLILAFLEAKALYNVNVVMIGDEVSEKDLPISERRLAKQKVIDLIRLANADQRLEQKYLGVIDLDYDSFNIIEEVDNLIYTDYHCVESYFLNLQTINKLITEHDGVGLSSKDFEAWLNNTLLLSFYFYFQLKEFDKFSVGQELSFSEIKFCNKDYYCSKTNRLKLGRILNDKTMADQDIKQLFKSFFFSMDRSKVYTQLLLFLHGKHTLRYVICRLKNTYPKLKKIADDLIILILKDKLVAYSELSSHQLFQRIELFAAA